MVRVRVIFGVRYLRNNEPSENEMSPFYHSLKQVQRSVFDTVNTYNVDISFTDQKVCLLCSQIAEMLTYISRINEPTPGIFVLF